MDLVISDRTNGKSINRALEKVSVAEPGAYDLVLMDIQMPVMDGYEATGRIRQLDRPEQAPVPIIAMTANAFDADRKAAIACGMNGFISKPITGPFQEACALQFMKTASGNREKQKRERNK